MRQIAQSYSYNSSTKVLTLTGVNVPQGNLVLIYNVTAGKRAYSVDLGFIDAISAYSQATNSTVTLRDGSGFSNSDVFSVVYEDGVQSTAPLTDTQLRATAVPISGTVTANTGLTPLTDTQLRATAVPVTGTFWQATQPVSLASVPSHDVTGSGSFTAAQATAANLNATVVGSGSFTAAQATASSLKAQAQILNSAGSLITYAESGTYGNPSVDVISVQNPQGTSAAIATFTSTTASSALVSATTARKTLTVYNSGAGDLYISPTATCTTTNFQIKLASNDYWECPAQQVTLAHTAVFSSAGTAYVTTIS